MPTYRRRDSSDSWHWCKDCSNWPSERPYEMSFSKPASGVLCSECKEKEKD